MSQTLSNSTTLRSMSGLFGTVQMVSHSNGVLVDIAARQYDVEGNLHRQNALVSFDLDDARRLHDLLGCAIEAAECAEPRQPGLWSDSTTRAIGKARGGRRVAA